MTYRSKKSRENSLYLTGPSIEMRRSPDPGEHSPRSAYSASTDFHLATQPKRENLYCNEQWDKLFESYDCQLTVPTLTRNGQCEKAVPDQKHPEIPSELSFAVKFDNLKPDYSVQENRARFRPHHFWCPPTIPEALTRSAAG